MAPATSTGSPHRRRLLPAIVVLAALSLVGGGVYLAFGGGEDEDPSPGTDPVSTAVPATFAVDLSTGNDDPPEATAFMPAPTLPLPSISLPIPGTTLPVATTVGGTTLTAVPTTVP